MDIEMKFFVLEIGWDFLAGGSGHWSAFFLIFMFVVLLFLCSF